MSKPSGFTLALVCLAMGLLTVQSVTVVNQLKDDTKGHVELMKEASDHDHDAFEAAVAMGEAVKEELGNLPMACAKFFKNATGCDKPGDITTGVVRDSFKKCCVVGGHPESLCDSLSGEAFNEDDPKASVTNDHCNEMVRLRQAHDDWTHHKDAAATLQLLEHADSDVSHTAASLDDSLRAKPQGSRRRRRHSNARDNGPWRRVPFKELLTSLCNKCERVKLRVGWTAQHSEACSTFVPLSNIKIILPSAAWNFDVWNDKCFYPAVAREDLFLHSRRRIIVLDRSRLLVPNKLKQGCGCLKKLVAPQQPTSEDRAKQFLCNCKGLCTKFRKQITGYCPDGSLVEKYKQNQSAVPEPKALMRSERKVSEPTVSQQVLMRKEAASESRQESTLDETLEPKCPDE